jgi:S1-C subfamily serine protease/acetyl esterase/lipase
MSPLSVTVWLGLALPLPAQQPADFEALQEQAIKAAVERVAPSVVRIETSGGAEVLSSGPRGPMVRKGVGPTTGLVVSADGYLISSAFNFANKPASIFVAVPGRKDGFVARLVATDTTRMLTLLKIDATGLPVPEAAPKQDIRVGQTALALGRTYDSPEHLPSVTVGIVSALGRIWGKAIQTDAKVSPANYGGPLLDLEGRVLGVLVPASPHGEDETAGVEWYDSGIGFAVPLEDVNRVLPRLKQGKDLHRGMLGVLPKSSDIYGVEATIGTVLPSSPAGKAGLRSGDVITEIDGRPVRNQAQVLHALGSRYEGDKVSLKVRRGKDDVAVRDLTLASSAQATAAPFLGVLPMRDDPELGVAVRYVFPKSPAEAAGIKEGDRILKVGSANGRQPQPFSGRDQFAAVIASVQPGTELKFEVKRKAGKTETLTARLAEMPDTVPDELPAEASQKKALEPRKQVGPRFPMPPVGGDKPPEPEPMPPRPKPPQRPPAPPTPPARDEAPKADPKKKAETGLLNRTNAAADHQYFVYVPKDYDPNISYGLVIWLHPVGKNRKQDVEDFTDTWEDYCKENHLIVVGPKAENENGWVASEAEFVQEAVRNVLANYTIDRRRVVAHGMGVGGQMAFYLGFHARDLVRGVATTGAALTSPPKERLVTEPVSFFLVAGGRDPLAKSVAETRDKLAGHKFPVVYREIPNMGHQYLDARTLDELARWIDSLDRI